jgi:MOSC domain-containing protein YiiM
VGRVEQILIKRMKRGPMDAVDRATLVAGRGIAGNANQGGKRQVTILSREKWDELMTSLGSALEPRARRANLVVSGVELAHTHGRILRVGSCRLRVKGETRPCEQMEDAFPGLQAAMRPHWGGGAFAEVVEGGDIAVGDEVAWDVT